MATEPCKKDGYCQRPDGHAGQHAMTPDAAPVEDFEAVRHGLRLGYRDGFCPYCGKADPNDDEHYPMCGLGEAFDALTRIEAAS